MMIHSGIDDAFHLALRQRAMPGWIWELAGDARPIDDLVLLSQVLTGFMNPPAGYPVPGTAQDQLAAWQRLRSLYHNDFSVSGDAVIAWHSGQALLSDEKHQSAGVVFHLERVLKLAPEDSLMRDRLNDARQRLGQGAEQ